MKRYAGAAAIVALGFSQAVLVAASVVLGDPLVLDANLASYVVAMNGVVVVWLGWGVVTEEIAINESFRATAALYFHALFAVAFSSIVVWSLVAG